MTSSRDLEIIALARRIPRVEGVAMLTLEAIGDEFGITGKSVDRILRNYSKKTGYKFGFRRDSKVKTIWSPEHVEGVCLLCKQSTESPVDYYRDKICPACFGTGKYRAEIMGQNNKDKKDDEGIDA